MLDILKYLLSLTQSTFLDVNPTKSFFMVQVVLGVETRHDKDCLVDGYKVIR